MYTKITFIKAGLACMCAENYSLIPETLIYYEDAAVISNTHLNINTSLTFYIISYIYNFIQIYVALISERLRALYCL